MLTMTKTHFRILIIIIIVIFVVGGIIDFLWPNEITEQIATYAAELEPEWSGTKLVFFIMGMVLLFARSSVL